MPDLHETPRAESPGPKDDETRRRWCALVSAGGPFASLPAEVVGFVVDCMRERSFVEGDLLMAEGTSGDCMIVLSAGAAEVSVRDREGQRHSLATVGEGAILGEMALLTSEPRNADVRATSAGAALELQAADFTRLVDSHPDIAVVLTNLVAERLGQGPRDGLGEKVFHGYRILGRLGLGAMAVVYEAESVEDGKRVALKMMSHRLVFDEAAVARFDREVGIVESFEHPNVVRVFDRFAAYGTQFMVQEFCDGPALDRLIERCGPLPEEQVRRIVGQLALALRHVHSHDLIHQDIKPANVLLMRDGTVKLVDFGIATQRNEEPEDAPAERPISGTPLYMAPEQLRGGEVGRKTDFHALGCIVYELLNGTALFAARSFSELMQRKLQRDILSREEVARDLSDELYDVFHATMALKREDRVLDLERLGSWAAPVETSLIERAMSA